MAQWLQKEEADMMGHQGMSGVIEVTYSEGVIVVTEEQVVRAGSFPSCDR